MVFAKTATAVVGAEIRTTQYRFVPRQAPRHLTNLLPRAGAAVSVTTDPASRRSAQNSPHWISAPEPPTVPLPRPARETTSR